MSKLTAYTMIIGLIVGILFEVLFPQILFFEFKNNINNLSNISGIKGSVYTVGFWFPVFISIVAGLLSEIYIKLFKNYRQK